jgi:hypothetical protein
LNQTIRASVMEREDREEYAGADEIEEKIEYELWRDMRVVELAKQFLPVQAVADNL